MSNPTKLAKKAERLAIEKRLDKKPFCYACGLRATTAHHHIPKSLSNYLRCDEKNLVPICLECHFKHHKRSDPDIGKRYEREMIKEFGKNWHDNLQKDRREFIKNNTLYWRNIIDKLEI